MTKRSRDKKHGRRVRARAGSHYDPDGREQQDPALPSEDLARESPAGAAFDTGVESIGNGSGIGSKIIAQDEVPATDKQVNKVDRQILNKFYRRRHQLFTRFDEGIRLSDTMWYSVTPENLANRIAARVSELWSDKKPITSVIDVCGGAGGNSIAFAAAGFKTFCIERDRTNTMDALNNSHVYGIYNIDFINSDIFKLDLAELGVDPATALVYSSPEWGGPAYDNNPVFDNNRCIPPVESLVTWLQARGYTNICIYLPRTADLNQLATWGATKIDYLFDKGWCRALCAWWC